MKTYFQLNDRVIHDGRIGTIREIKITTVHDFPVYHIFFDVYTSYNDGYDAWILENYLENITNEISSF